MDVRMTDVQPLKQTFDSDMETNIKEDDNSIFCDSETQSTHLVDHESQHFSVLDLEDDTTEADDDDDDDAADDDADESEDSEDSLLEFNHICDYVMNNYPPYTMPLITTSDAIVALVLIKAGTVVQKGQPLFILNLKEDLVFDTDDETHVSDDVKFNGQDIKVTEATDLTELIKRELWRSSSEMGYLKKDFDGYDLSKVKRSHEVLYAHGIYKVIDVLVEEEEEVKALQLLLVYDDGKLN